MARSFTNPSNGSLPLEEKIALYARVPHYVLITGERGTGKTTLAKQLHEMSPRSRKEFVSVNCASFTADLLESELFGYEKGAFTGANAAKEGLFESAEGGTLFLDDRSAGKTPESCRRKTHSSGWRQSGAGNRCKNNRRNFKEPEHDGE